MTETDPSDPPAASRSGDRAASTRRLATAMLASMAAIFAAIFWLDLPEFWHGLIRTGAEAGMIGGLADWFAVTALFRRPMGLPIPHTAVIPRSKDRIAAGIGAFVEQYLLDPAQVATRLRAAEPSRRLAQWLAVPANAAAAADRLGDALPFLMASLKDEDIREFLRAALAERLSGIDAAPLLGRGLAVMRDGDRHQAALDRLLAVLHDYLRDNAHKVYLAVEDRSNWWVPRAVDRRVAQALLEGLAELLHDLGERDHELRGRFDAAIDRFIDDLQHSDRYADEAERLKRALLESPQARQWFGNLWDEVRARLVADLNDDRSRLRPALAGALRALGESLAANPALQARFDARLAGAVRVMIGPWRAEIGRYVADVVRGWEANTVTARLETAVGRDLQYIRINGTLVGCLVGCVLYLIVIAID
jgi:uncharacterized membrane-anchored protein YjiN (DUF445 family)